DGGNEDGNAFEVFHECSPVLSLLRACDGLGAAHLDVDATIGLKAGLDLGGGDGTVAIGGLGHRLGFTLAVGVDAACVHILAEQVGLHRLCTALRELLVVCAA